MLLFRKVLRHSAVTKSQLMIPGSSGYGYAVRRDVVETVDIEGGCGVSCDDFVRVFESPFQPLIEEMALDPAVAVLWVFQEFELIDFDGCLACLAVFVSS